MDNAWATAFTIVGVSASIASIVWAITWGERGKCQCKQPQEDEDTGS